MRPCICSYLATPLDAPAPRLQRRGVHALVLRGLFLCSESVDAFVTGDDKNVGTSLREQPHRYHSHDLIDLALERDGVGDLQVMHVEDVVAVVRGDVLTPYGPSTEIR